MGQITACCDGNRANKEQFEPKRGRRSGSESPLKKNGRRDSYDSDSDRSRKRKKKDKKHKKKKDKKRKKSKSATR